VQGIASGAVCATPRLDWTPHAPPLPTPASSAQQQQQQAREDASGSIPTWLASARTRQEELCRTVEHLYGAIALLEARAEVREAELARAENSSRTAAAASAALLKAQYEAALSVKDSALRAAREQVSALVAAVAEMQGASIAAAFGGGGEGGISHPTFNPPTPSAAPLPAAPMPPTPAKGVGEGGMGGGGVGSSFRPPGSSPSASLAPLFPAHHQQRPAGMR